MQKLRALEFRTIIIDVSMRYLCTNCAVHEGLMDQIEHLKYKVLETK